MNLTTLHALISSMSGIEHREFDKLVVLKDKQKNYISLFDYLGKTKDLNFKALEKQYGKNGLEAARKHLTKIVMKAIREADSQTGIENKLIDLLKEAQILHRKGFVKDSFQKLIKVKEMALNNEQYTYFIISARLELRYLLRGRFTGVTELELIEKQRFITDILEHEIQLHRHSSLHKILSIRFINKGLVSNQQEKLKLNDLLLEENLILNNRNYRSFHAKKVHLNFQSIYFLMIGDHEESLKIFYELTDLFQNNKPLWAESPEYYFALLDGILTDLYAMERYTEMMFFIKQLSSVNTDSEDLRLNVELFKAYYTLAVLNQTGESDKGQKMIKEDATVIGRMNKVPSADLHAQLFLMVSLMHFNNGEYKNCGRLLNYVLNNPDVNLTNQTYNQLKTMYLITQYELKNLDYLPYQIRSFQRRLNLGTDKNEIEKVVVMFIKKLCADDGLTTKQQQQFMQSITELEVSPQYRTFIQKLQLKKWVNTIVNHS
jgi:hypothetical protein